MPKHHDMPPNEAQASAGDFLWDRERATVLRVLVNEDNREQKQIADDAQISRSTLQRVLAGTAHPKGKIVDLARVLGVAVGRLFEVPITQALSTVAVPVYDVEVAAGAGRFVDGLPPATFDWLFSLEWAEANLGRVDALKMFFVHGESQEPELSSGDIVAVDTSNTTIRRGGMYVVRYGESLLIKRLVQRGEYIDLISRNAEANPTFSIHVSEKGVALDIIGRAVWASKML